MKAKKIALIVGSLRRGSFNRKTAKAIIALAPENLDMEILEIERLELYNQDLDQSPPQSWIDFRNRVKTYDGFIFFTPEYNRSVPAVLKNALDVGSRPYGHNSWDNKPCAVISVSMGSMGGFGANHHLRQSLVYLNMPTMPQPEVYIGKVEELFDDKDVLTNESTRELLWKFMGSFESWIVHNGEQIPREDWWNNRPKGLRGNWLAELADV